MPHLQVAKLFLAILVLDVCLVCGAERAGLQPAGAIFQLDDTAALLPAEDGKDRLISSLRKPEFLGFEHRSRAWDSESLALVGPFNSLGDGSSAGASSPGHVRHFQPIAVQILLCVWLI